jgi:hypothetical protein
MSDLQFDPQFVKKIIGQDGIHPTQFNDELKDLFNPSIHARPLHMPTGTRIKEMKRKEFHFHWCFDRCGSTPNHSRVEELRGSGEGWDYATTADVEMYSSDTVKSKNEIRIGDMRLMKIPLMRWREIRKAQNIQALEYINPRRPNAKVMTLENTQGLRSYMVNAEDVSGSARVGTVEVGADGEGNPEIKSFSGNASVAHVRS